MTADAIANEGRLTRIEDKLDVLIERVEQQNGRIGHLEQEVEDIQRQHVISDAISAANARTRARVIVVAGAIGGMIPGAVAVIAAWR